MREAERQKEEAINYAKTVYESANKNTKPLIKTTTKSLRIGLSQACKMHKLS